MYMFMCMRIYTPTLVDTIVDVRVLVCVRVCPCVHVCACVRVCACVCICMYIQRERMYTYRNSYITRGSEIARKKKT